jgi:LacI family transcriptional regulator, repressor for deo operon, udp, cdd, tsx, nupC, and nupG
MPWPAEHSDGSNKGTTMTTIQDVARHAAVSTATVSRVLSNPAIVTKDTRERVTRAIAELNYEPNPAARTLRTLKSGRILVTVPDISNPFFSEVIRGVEETAQDLGYSVLLGDTRYQADREEQYAGFLKRREADGLIFLGHRLPELLVDVVEGAQGRAPIVNGCEYSADLGVSSVHIDNATAAADAMTHLYRLGHQRIGVVTGPLSSPLSRDRLDGTKQAAAAHDFGDHLIVRNGDFTIEAGEREASRMLALPEPPTAIFCFNDEMALGALAAVRKAGLACPEDVSVMGFDDIHFSRYMVPPLTTIRQPMAQIGQETVRLLHSILSDGNSKPVSCTLPHELVVRDSTGPVLR